MDALRTGISMLGLVEQDDTPGPRAALLAQAERLLGQTPSILAALLANLGIAVAKFTGYLFTGSAAMLRLDDGAKLARATVHEGAGHLALIGPSGDGEGAE